MINSEFTAAFFTKSRPKLTVSGKSGLQNLSSRETSNY